MSKTTTRPDPEDVSTWRDVAQWYWTRAELNAVARRVGVPSSGNKQNITQRLLVHLGQPGSASPAASIEAPGDRRKSNTQMPGPYAEDQVVPAGQRMTRELREWFLDKCGPGFRFDGHMRDFFAAPEGRTLGDAVKLWFSTRGVPRPSEPQFEYNRFVREYRKSHPAVGHAEVVAAWRAHRETRRG